MIVNNKYKVYWVHTPLYTGALNKDGTKYVSGYNRSFSDCIITFEEPSSIVNKDNTRDMATKILTQGRSIVHPNDTFDRKKGVFYSFKNAVENLQDRRLRTDFWKEYWRIRKVGKETSTVTKTINNIKEMNAIDNIHKADLIQEFEQQNENTEKEIFIQKGDNISS